MAATRLLEEVFTVVEFVNQRVSLRFDQITCLQSQRNIETVWEMLRCEVWSHKDTCEVLAREMR